MRPVPATLAFAAFLSLPAAARAETTLPANAYTLDLDDDVLSLAHPYPERT